MTAMTDIALQEPLAEQAGISPRVDILHLMSNVGPEVQGLPGEADVAAHLAGIRQRIRRYIIEDRLLGTTEELDDAASLSRNGILDSTGALELVTFLEEEFAIVLADRDLVPANLDSVDGIVAMVDRKLAGGRPEEA